MSGWIFGGSGKQWGKKRRTSNKKTKKRKSTECERDGKAGTMGREDSESDEDHQLKWEKVLTRGAPLLLGPKTRLTENVILRMKAFCVDPAVPGCFCQAVDNSERANASGRSSLSLGANAFKNYLYYVYNSVEEETPGANIKVFQMESLWSSSSPSLLPDVPAAVDACLLSPEPHHLLTGSNTHTHTHGSLSSSPPSRFCCFLFFLFLRPFLHLFPSRVPFVATGSHSLFTSLTFFSFFFQTDIIM